MALPIARYRHYITSIFMLTLFSQGCVEPFEAATEDFESVLVIDALITNELKYQQINLNRTFRFEEEEAGGEVGATVRVLDDMQNEYVFVENNPGQYVSEAMFAAQPNVSYQLSITTTDDRTYLSDPVLLTKNTALGDLSAALQTNDQNVEGVAILVDTFDPEGESRYYRFEYEETYRIVAPFWSPQDLIIVSESPPIFNLVPKSQEEQVCYNTVNSVDIILGSTAAFTEDRLTRFPVRFLARDNYIIAHRYSILVKQFIISREAHTYYETLDELSGLESLFSENQPGFFAGNISQQDDSTEKVIGFFDVSYVSERRIFFDHEAFFPDDLIPAFPDDCRITTPLASELLSAVKFGTLKFFAGNDPADTSEGFYKMVPRICGDCTVLGSNVVPDFWIE